MNLLHLTHHFVICPCFSQSRAKVSPSLEIVVSFHLPVGRSVGRSVDRVEEPIANRVVDVRWRF